jgi:AcrR family transcriptional regulator
MNIKKLTKRKQQALTTRQLIFETAVTMFRKKSYDQITINHICRKAGISIGTFYHHFKSKEQIIAEEYLKLDEFYIEPYNKLRRDVSALDRLIMFNGIMSKRFAEMGVHHLRIVYYSEIGPKRKKKFLIDEKRPIFRILGELVRDAQEKGEIRNDLDCSAIVDILVKFSRGNIYDWVLRNGDFDFELRAAQILEALLQGLMPRENKTPLSSDTEQTTKKHC